MPGQDETARKLLRQQAQQGSGADRPLRLNLVALHRRRLILAKVAAEQRGQRSAKPPPRMARRAAWIAVLLLTLTAAAKFMGLLR